jgi:predicted component of type VI protein secretion system
MILNTRSTSKTKKTNYPMPENFGLDEYTYLSPQGSDSVKIIRNFIKVIENYEPRLLKPSIRILRYDKVFQKLFIEIYGTVKLGERLERFSFPLDIGTE